MNRLLRLSVLFILLFLTGSAAFSQTADFTASPISGCSPLLVNFFDNSSGTITSYTWNLGNTNTSAFQNPSTTYYTPGTYTVSLTVTGPGGSDTKTINSFITVYDQPTVAFTATTAMAGCTPHNVQFNSTVTANAPGGVTYDWNFGDGTTGTGSAPAHNYTTPGTYSVSLTVTNGAGCSTTVTRNAYITAYPIPVGGFSANQTTFCNAPAAVTFTNTSTGGTAPYTATWDFGDGSTGAGNTVTHTYNNGGTYTVTMTVTDLRGCPHTVINAAYITVTSTIATFSAPANVCAEAEASFVNTTPGGGGAFWDFGDGYTTTGPTATHSYLLPGTYSVTMTIFINGCTKTATRTVVVNPKPKPTITMFPSVPCPAPVTVSFTGNSPFATSYTWTWAGGSATGSILNKNYPAGPPYFQDRIVLIATSAFGCMDSTIIDTIYIRNIIADITPGNPLEGCKTLVVTFGIDLRSNLPPPPPNPPPLPPYPVPAIAWSWDFGNGHTSSLANPTDSFVNAGNYVVSCTFTTANGCTQTTSRNVHVDVPIKPNFSASPLTVCPNVAVTFVNLTSHIPGLTYNWNLGDTSFPKADTGRVTRLYPDPGTYTTTLYSNNHGCLDSSVRVDYVVVHPPGARFNEVIDCNPPTTVHFTNTSIAPTSQLWDFGDGTTDTAFSPTHNYPDTGTYIVTLTVYNSTYNCSDVTRKRIILFSPVLAFSASSRAVCRNQYVRFQGIFTGSGTVSYAWLFDNFLTSFSSDAEYDYRFTTNGLHDVSLITMSGNGCLDTFKQTGYIFVSQPEVHFYATPPIGCQPMAVVFTDTSRVAGINNVQRRWSFGDGSVASSTRDTVHYTYPAKGRYTVSLSVIDSLGCADSLIRYSYISVNKAQAFFTANDTTVCTHQGVTFIDTLSSAGQQLHQWSFGDGGTDTGTHPTHAYNTPGLYTVRLIVIDSVGCRDTFIRNNYVRADAPHAAFTPSSRLSACTPLSVTFTNTSTGASSYSWTFGTGGGPVVPTNPTQLFTTAGLYNITLVATDINGCTDTARDTVRVLGYNGAFSYTPTEGCAPMTVQFYTSITGIPQITWDFGDGSTTTTINSAPTSHTYATAGGYLPKAIFSSSPTCTSFSVGLDSIKADKLTAGFRWSVPCAGVAFQLYDTSTALYNSPVSWSWSFGGGNSSSGNTTSYSFATPGDHLVTLVATNATGCKDSVTRPVFVNYLPPVKAPEDRGVCPGTIVTLTATGAQSYEWSPASLVSCVACVTTTVQLLSSDTMVITLRGTDGNGCVNTDEVRIYEKLNTTAITRPGGEICVGESFRLFAEGADVYAWLPAATIDSPSIASPLATPTTTTTYIVVAKEGTCNVDSQRVTVVVHPRPLFNAGPDQTINLGSTVTLHASHSGIDHVVWAKDSTLSCLDCFDPNAYPYYTRTYYVTGYSEYGCTTTDGVTVHVRCNGSLVYIPNTFSPNGDGLNDYFYPRGEGIERMYVFRVYNRWGELLYEGKNVALNDERAGWDGRYKGQLLTPDVYVYTMESRCVTGELVTFKGDITIMR